MQNTTRNFFVTTAVIALAGAVTPAWGQTAAPAAAQTAATPEDGDQLHEIIVTSQKRSQNVQDTPFIDELTQSNGGAFASSPGAPRTIGIELGF